MKMADVYCRCFSPVVEMTAFTGPVRQVDAASTKPVTIAPAPQATAIALVGGLWPFARRIAMPCAFCTASTVITRGGTNSTSAAHENRGA